MDNETPQQPAQPEAPATEAAPGGKPSSTMDNNPAVDVGKIAKAAAAVVARQTERGEGPEDDLPPAPTPEPTDAPQEAAAPAEAPQEGERPPLSKTDYWAHLDELQADLRQAQAQAKRGVPENVGELPVNERLQLVGLDLRDPQMLDSLLDALGTTGTGDSQAEVPEVPEGADPMVAQLLQQQQAMQRRLDEYEQGNRTTQEQLQHDQRQAALRAEEGKFAEVLRAAPEKWPVAAKAIEKGVVPLGFANEVADSMERRLGHAPTYGQVLTGIDAYLREEATKTSALLAEVDAGAAQPEPAPAPAAPPPEAPTTLTPVAAEASDRPLTREERVKRAAALVKERQRSRKAL